MPLPLHVQLANDMGALEGCYWRGEQIRLDGLTLDPMHDALLYSSMVLLAVDGCIRLCRHLQEQQQLVSS